MRLLMTVLLLFTGPALAGDEVRRLSEPVAVTDSHELFGAPLPETGEALRLAEVIARSEELAGREILVTTRVAKVCQKKGCFFIARDGDAVARVTFLDYGFFVPTDSGGKEVTLAGVFSRQELSAEQARHFAQDLGETPAEPLSGGFEYSIVASAVRIPRG